MDDKYWQVITGDCLEVMPTLADSSIDLILTDPPYYKVKNEWWDRQWDTAAGFLSWLDDVLAEFYRVLKPNGSLYLFASPRMAARVEVKIAERFNVLNRIRWIKEDGWHKKTNKESLRFYLSPYEEIIFAEHNNEPIWEYLESERRRAGVSKEDINEALGFRRNGGMASRKYFGPSQWQLPTAENYEKMREVMSSLNHGGQYLQREYEDIRRPFNVTADVPYTDVWTFPTVQSYPGKHPAEKPQALLRHIIAASSKPGAVILDAFAGSGSTGQAALDMGREFIGIDRDEHWAEYARQRIGKAAEQAQQMELFR